MMGLTPLFPYNCRVRSPGDAWDYKIIDENVIFPGPESLGAGETPAGEAICSWSRSMPPPDCIMI